MTEAAPGFKDGIFTCQKRQGANIEVVLMPMGDIKDIHLGDFIDIEVDAWAMDIEFYTASAFPEEYQGGAFLALHGSWNRSKRVGYRVDFVPFRDGRPISGPREFVSGWMLDPEEQLVWGRPVGILQLADGSLLISDDGGNKIWRVFYTG